MSAAASPLALDVARQLVHLLEEYLQAAGRAAHLEVGLDSPGPGLAELVSPTELPTAGLSCADADAAPERQLSAAGALHAIAGHGTARVLWPHSVEITPDGLIELLQFAGRRTELVRVLFLRRQTAAAQPEFDL
jgi:hypothetical protein